MHLKKILTSVCMASLLGVCVTTNAYAKDRHLMTDSNANSLLASITGLEGTDVILKTADLATFVKQYISFGELGAIGSDLNLEEGALGDLLADCGGGASGLLDGLGGGLGGFGDIASGLGGFGDIASGLGGINGLGDISGIASGMGGMAGGLGSSLGGIAGGFGGGMGGGMGNYASILSDAVQVVDVSVRTIKGDDVNVGEYMTAGGSVLGAAGSALGGSGAGSALSAAGTAAKVGGGLYDNVIDDKDKDDKDDKDGKYDKGKDGEDKKDEKKTEGEEQKEAGTKSICNISIPAELQNLGFDEDIMKNSAQMTDLITNKLLPPSDGAAISSGLSPDEEKLERQKARFALRDAAVADAYAFGAKIQSMAKDIKSETYDKLKDGVSGIAETLQEKANAGHIAAEANNIQQIISNQIGAMNLRLNAANKIAEIKLDD